MRNHLLAVLLTVAVAGTAIAAEIKTANETAPSGNATMQPTGAAQGGSFRWSNTRGDVEVVKGKIDKWNEKGQLEAGGVLGLGDTDLTINGETVIVTADGHRLQRSDLRVGRHIATIYREGNKAEKKGTGEKGKTALVIVVEK